MLTDSRAPQTRRASTSRPNWSVPSRCARLGPLSRAPKSIATGSAVTNSGATSPTRAVSPTMASPTSASRLRQSRPSARWRVGSGEAEAGVEDDIERVDGEVHERDQQGDGQDHALEHRVVAVDDRVHRELAHAGPREDLLGDDRAPQQDAELHAEHGDGRDQGVADRVAHDNTELAQPLAPRRADVVASQLLQQLRP